MEKENRIEIKKINEETEKLLKEFEKKEDKEVTLLDREDYNEPTHLKDAVGKFNSFKEAFTR